jgi:serine/threonine protein kinase
VKSDPLRRRVALKILKGAYANNKKILNRTRDEARLLSRLNHPNIVRVERLMDVGGRPVVVMEHVQGVSLDQLLLRFKDGLPGAIALETIRLTCLALHVAYREALGEDGTPLKVIHRDIKPSNILLSIHGEVKVVDFGIAKGEFEGREADTESVVMGSRPYMAPERLDGILDSPSVDVYSSGMSLFELLTGRTMSLSINPISHDQAMKRQLGYIQIEGMSEVGLEDTRNLIRRMCAYERDYRPSAQDCARDLEQLVYAVDPRYRIGLEEFARTTVLPLYESRPRIAPEDAVTGDDDFLLEVTGALTNSTPKSTQAIKYTPYVFVAILAFLFVFLGALAAVKLARDTWTPPPTVTPSNGKVRIKVWFPSDAQVQVGNVFLSTPGTARVRSGQNLLQVMFNDGRIQNCAFEASRDVSVRYVLDAGKPALTVNDESTSYCVEVKAATKIEVEPARARVKAKSKGKTKGKGKGKKGRKRGG